MRDFGRRAEIIRWLRLRRRRCAGTLSPSRNYEAGINHSPRAPVGLLGHEGAVPLMEERKPAAALQGSSAGLRRTEICSKEHQPRLVACFPESGPREIKTIRYRFPMLAATPSERRLGAGERRWRNYGYVTTKQSMCAWSQARAAAAGGYNRQGRFILH